MAGVASVNAGGVGVLDREGSDAGTLVGPATVLGSAAKVVARAGS
jgi:hypothetical protein